MFEAPIPEDIKYISQYITRAKELNSQEPIMSYYCLCYSVKLAISNGFATQESRDYITGLFDLLEQTKKNLSENEAVNSEVAGLAYVESFALKVFQAADNQEINGNATIKTVRAFMAAANFFDVLKYFDKELDPEVLQKSKYAKFKAAEIAKAIKEGKQTRLESPPVQSPEQNLQPTDSYQANKNENNNSHSTDLPANQTAPIDQFQSQPQEFNPIDRLPTPPIAPNFNSADINSISSFPPIPPNFQDPFTNNSLSTQPIPPPNQHFSQVNPHHTSFDLPSIPHHQPQPSSAPTLPQNTVSPQPPSPLSMNNVYQSLPPVQAKMLDPKLITQAEKCCRFAISSLQYDDLDEALRQILKAKELVEALKRQN